MDMPSTYTLVKLSDTNLDVVARDQDVRGRKVLDSAGKDVGHVDDLLIDTTEKKVRFLRVVAGGFLGIGGQKFLIPVDAVTKVDNDAVHVDRTREHVAAGPAYDPALEDSRDHADRVYAYYGYMPFWGVGYVYPMYPFYI